MKKIISIIIIMFILSSFESTVFAQDSKQIYEELDSMVQNLVVPDSAMGAVLSVVSNGEIQFYKGYGFADKYLGYDADGEKTAFRIGSVSKTFVAVAAQILNQQGLIDMNQDISNYLESDFPSPKYPVTMKELLTHTAGFEDIVTGIAVFNISDTEPLAKSVRKYMPAQAFKPGEVVSYSNYGTALAAYVIECISNQDFAQFCQEQIFKPLDMTRTTFEYMHDVVYVSKPYLPSGNETIEPFMNLYPEGSAVSTAEDMAKYMIWLLNSSDNRILSSDFKKEMFSKQFTMSDELEGIGYIWNRKERNNEVYYEKKGETLNFYTRVALYPKNQTGIFVSFNTFLPEHKINALIKKATDLLYGEQNNYNFSPEIATIDIKGLYANNWSSFNTTEKILRYLIPNKMIQIRGSQENGYYINGDVLELIGKDIYSSSIGLLKFQKINNKIILATESGITFSKVPLWQHISIQLLVPSMFFILTFICFTNELLKKKTKNYYFVISYFIQIIFFITLFMLMYKGIITYSLLNYSLYIKICGSVILSFVLTNIGYTTCKAKKNKTFNPSSIAWNLTAVLFVSWIIWFNII